MATRNEWNEERSFLTSKFLLWHNPPPLFHSLLVENVLWTEFSLLCLESIRYVCLPPHFLKKIFPPICVVVPVAVASILPLFVPSSFLFCKSFCHGEGQVLSTAMLRSRLGLRKVTFEPPCKLRKGKSHPSCFHVWCHLGYMLIMSNCLWLLGVPASFCIVLCGIHCLDHAGCQGCCCDTNNIWDTSVPVRYLGTLNWTVNQLNCKRMRLGGREG